MTINLSYEGQMDGYVRIAQVAKRFDVTTRTVTRWVKSGYFPGAKKLNPHAKNSPLYIPVDAIEDFEQRQENVLITNGGNS